MKKLIVITAFLFMNVHTHAQDAYTQQMQSAVTKLDHANSINDYQQLAGYFAQLATVQTTKWLPHYYAAFCNAKIGWLKQDTDPDNIQIFADKADEEIKKALSLIDTSSQKKELSEIYCVQMILNQARVFINPETYGPKYGPAAFNFTRLAEKANADNPRMLYLAGWQKFATPKAFGGDKEKAKQLLTLAKEKLEAQSSTGIGPRWGKREVNELLQQIK